MRSLPFLLFVSLLLVAGWQPASSQTLTTPDLNKSLIPPSPDAAALGKYGIIPVSLYTGMPNVSVPVYELKSSKLSVPISLGYNYNGYKPGEEASWVGLGWSLQAGGMITRVVKDMADEYTGSTYQFKWQQYANILDLTNNMDFMAEVGERMVDTEPDIYIFNFNGHSGKFIMVGDRAYLMPAQDLRILQVGNEFRITAEDGVTYFFQDLETTTPNNNTTPGSYMPPYTSAWYLTKMVTADNTDEIDFQYAMWSHRQSNAAYQESYQRQNGGMKNNSWCGGVMSNCDVWTVNNYVGAFITAKRLTKISCKAGYINFIPEDATRLDLGSTNAYALKEIDVYRPDSLLIKKMGLVHDYFGSGGPTQLKLNAVSSTGYFVNTIQGSGTGTVDSIAVPGYYTFQYNDGSFPKGTRGIDKWGYYNGKFNNAMLFDSTVTPYPAVMPFADRSVNTAYSSVGTLSTMTYPTGGFTTFTYEGNVVAFTDTRQRVIQKYAMAEAVYQSSDGPVTREITSFHIDTPQTVSLSFGRTLIPADTTFGAHNDSLIVHLYLQNQITDGNTLVYTSPRLGPTVTADLETISLDTGWYVLNVSCQPSSIESHATVAYTFYDHSPYLGDPGPGMRIKAITSYDNINNSTPALTKIYTYPPATVLSFDGVGENTVTHQYVAPGCGSGGTYQEYIFSSSYSSPLASLIDNQFFYPNVTEINHDSIGTGKTVYEYQGDGTDALGIQLIRQTDYAYQGGSYLPIRQKSNTYTIKNLINFQAFTHNISQVYDNLGSCLASGLVSPDPLDTSLRYILYAPSSYILASNFNYLTATDETNYDQNGTNPMALHTDYFYDNPNFFQPTRTVVQNSKGYPITTLTKYPLDYTYVSCTPLYTVDTTFKSARDAASINYQYCTMNRYDAAFPYWNPAIQNSANTALLNALRSYPCENTYATSYASVVNTMNTSVWGHYACLTGNFLPDAQSAIVNMQANNIISTPVEQIVTINRGGTDYLFGANRTDFTVNHLYGSSPSTLYQTMVSSSNILASDFLANPGNYYEPRVSFKYDALDNILEQSKTNDVKMSYLWDYHTLYPIAQVSNADTGSIAYTSFEADGSGNWAIPAGGVTGVNSGITGSKSYTLSNGAISRSGLSTSRTYLVSFWLKTGGTASVAGGTAPVAKITKNGWTYYESTVSGATSVSVSGSGSIDELRLYPTDAQMTTYTFDPLIGITGTCNPSSQLTYYYYDPLVRLKYVKDGDGNILKTLEYHYAIQ